MLYIGLGGFIGANLRYFVCDWASRRWGASFPYGTLLVNILGSFVVGLLLVVMAEQFDLDPQWKQLLVTGFLGAFTTFSSFMNEGVTMMTTGNISSGIFYLFGSVGVGLIAVLAGSAVGALIIGRLALPALS